MRYSVAIEKDTFVVLRDDNGDVEVLQTADLEPNGDALVSFRAVRGDWLAVSVATGSRFSGRLVWPDPPLREQLGPPYVACVRCSIDPKDCIDH